MALQEQQLKLLRSRLEQRKRRTATQAPARQEKKEDSQSIIGGLLEGGGKGLLSTLKGASSLGEKGLKSFGRLVTPKKFEEKFGFQKESPTGAEQLIPEEFTTAENLPQKIGFTLEQISEFFVPASKIAKLEKGATLAQKAAIGATTMAGQTALQEGEFGKASEAGAVIGAFSPVVGKAVGAISRQVEQMPERLVRSALNRSKKEVLKEIATKSEDTLANFVLKNKSGLKTANQHIDDSLDEIRNLSSEINAVLKKKSGVTSPKLADGVTRVKQRGVVRIDDILKNVVNDVNKAGGAVGKADVKAIVDRLSPQARGLLRKTSMSLEDANKLRQSLDRTLGDSGFLTAELPFNKEVLRQFDNTLRNAVKDKAPETKKLFDTLKHEIRFRDGLLEKQAKRAGNQLIGFGDFIGGGLGGVFGGGIPGAIAGVSARRVLESTPFKIGTGKALQQVNELIPIIKKLSPAQRGVIAQLLKGAF